MQVCRITLYIELVEYNYYQRLILISGFRASDGRTKNPSDKMTSTRTFSVENKRTSQSVPPKNRVLKPITTQHPITTHHPIIIQQNRSSEHRTSEHRNSRLITFSKPQNIGARNRITTQPPPSKFTPSKQENAKQNKNNIVEDRYDSNIIQFISIQ